MITTPAASGISALLNSLWKQESGALVATLTRVVGEVGLAEELAQEALVAALEQWPQEGIPDAPAAWLTTVARRRAVDHLRRTRRLAAFDPEGGAAPQDSLPDEDPDDLLRLMFLSCHPLLAPDERVAMTLRLLAGLSAAEIARAFLVHEQRVLTRIAAAKRTLAGVGPDFALTEPGQAAERLGSVLEVVYLIFNEGYTASEGDDLLRPGLVDEALRLGRLLAARAGQEPEVHGLLGLMELQASRSSARTDAAGAPLPLDEQDRSRWDRDAIRRGLATVLRAREVLDGPPGPYLLQAAIAVCHARARRPEDTDWPQIATLYDALLVHRPTSVVRLNRAVAVGHAEGPAAGLAAVDDLRDEPTLRDYHLLPAVRGDLLRRLGRDEEARRELRRAASLTRNHAERVFLLRRADALAAVAVSGPTLGPLVERFLARDQLSAGTRRSYRQTLQRLVRALGDVVPIGSLDAQTVVRVLTTTWADASPATWNRHRAAARSFALWAGRADLASELASTLPRRSPPPRSSPALSPAQLARLWGSPASPREQAFWRVLHESGARPAEVLALDVGELDLTAHRTRHEQLHWHPATSALLAPLVDGRASGPVFLSQRRPAPARPPAPDDLCPHTGRRRLSYETRRVPVQAGHHTTRPRGARLHPAPAPRRGTADRSVIRQPASRDAVNSAGTWCRSVVA